MALAGALVLALVGGVSWAVGSLSGGGAQPEDALPAGAVAFAKVDLDPSAGQKIDGFRFLRKFPALRERIPLDGDVREVLFDSFAEEAGWQDIDFDDRRRPVARRPAGLRRLPGREGRPDHLARRRGAPGHRRRPGRGRPAPSGRRVATAAWAGRSRSASSSRATTRCSRSRRSSPRRTPARPVRSPWPRTSATPRTWPSWATAWQPSGSTTAAAAGRRAGALRPDRGGSARSLRPGNRGGSHHDGRPLRRAGGLRGGRLGHRRRPGRLGHPPGGRARRAAGEHRTGARAWPTATSWCRGWSTPPARAWRPRTAVLRPSTTCWRRRRRRLGIAVPEDLAVLLGDNLVAALDGETDRGR